MSGKGQMPVPVEVLALRGSWKASKARKAAEPACPPGLPVRPKWDDPELLDRWDWLVEQLTAMRLLSSADQDTMEDYCRLVVMGRRCDDLETLLKVRAAKQQIQDRYGLSPSARARIGISLSRLQAPAPKTIDPASEFAQSAKEG